MINIIERRKIFLTFSSILVIASVMAIGWFGLKQGIDFKGGTLWQIRFNKEVAVKDLRQFFKEGIVTVEEGTNSFLIRLPTISEQQRRQYVSELEEKFGKLEQLKFESIGPIIGQELRRNAIWALVLVLLAISLYVAFVFRKVSYPVSSWKYGVVTLGTLFHDAVIPIGVTAFLGKEIGVSLVVAILVVIGFSVHDTIVVLDRTRENLRHAGAKINFAELVNQSVNQTLARSINTSLTLLFILAAMFFWGPESLKYFTLVILIGTIVGTYSSICVASSLIVIWRGK